MHPRHPQLPRLWLMTDERMGDAVLASVAALPRGAGVIFRHYATPMPQRRTLFSAVRRIARARRLVLLLADTPAKARGWRSDGAHGKLPGSVTASAHNVSELVAARRRGAACVFISPVFPTRSHVGEAALGRVGFGQLARQSHPRVIALGGMTRRKARSLSCFGIWGWAAIDALSGQKRNAVPT